MEPVSGLRHVAIVGRGLIGGSIERAVRERLPHVEVAALDRGDDLTGLEAADLVVLAAPILEIISLLDRIRPHVTADCVITDTGSTKTAVVAAAGNLRFVGGHPIAGAAASGAAAARADLFAGCHWILTPAHGTADADVERVRQFVSALGAHPRVMDPTEHDRLFAYLSHLPQLVVSALMHTVGAHTGTEALALSGGGLRDSTRLASSPPGIWRDVIETNRPQLNAALDDMIATLTTLRDDTSAESLRTIFGSAARWKRALEDPPI
ncbi:MAG TPA: prephenate dehydrogenase/arogenate dehydrogenase family protein [Vicinamibacterales bacterium]